ncbi:MAG: phosphoribosylformylglycinamidine synthase subunit PurS [Thermoleophilia bacterium]|jgi:phosphoribosylformylglycinamidine synthase|nr:phosphoribosylformylglycinamidine synthase subunit PurS [Actinomycetota bacterium]MCL6093419.1 phosphoribosylformylglycinamidine synthase subunit PurS [Actinomycetota bacterium]MDA8166532.1 phosphoribosylformylglycinamidine synthase subunit PurS [Actinomycetota bacterium]
MKAKVYITPKQGILDPQGVAIERSLPALGFEGVANVRVGKYIELELPAGDGAADEVDKMCHKLLANPIIEDFRFELETE